MLSFPIAGFTLALDFPLTNGIFEFLDDIDRLVPNDFQPRVSVDDTRLAELTRSIQSNGIIQPKRAASTRKDSAIQ